MISILKTTRLKNLCLAILVPSIAKQSST